MGLPSRLGFLLERAGGAFGSPAAQRAAFVVLGALLLLAKLGAGHLANFDDCMIAERAKEMLRDGHWITPHFDGMPMVDNPPLFQWLVAISFAGLGVNNYAAILPSALSGIACVVVVHRLARDLELDSFAAWAAGFVLLTTQYFTKYARHAMMDVFLTLLVLLALRAYWRALAGERRQFLVFGLFTGAAVLTKSVLGLSPLAIAIVHPAWTGRARTILTPWFLAGVALAVGLGGWWFVYEAIARPEAFAAKWQWMLWTRSLGSGRSGVRWRSVLDYLVSIAKIYWPWLPLAAVGAAIAGRRALQGGAEASRPAPVSVDAARLLIVWFLVVVGPLSLAREKKLWYVMAVFPCLALWAGIAAGRWVRDDSTRRRVIGGGFALLLAAALIVQCTPIGLGKERRPDLQRMALVARTIVPAGTRLLNLDADYWTTAPQFLFYSDRGLNEPLGDPARVRLGLDQGGFALLTREGYDRVAGPDTASYPMVMASGEWTLVKKAPRPAVVLSPADPFR